MKYLVYFWMIVLALILPVQQVVAQDNAQAPPPEPVLTVQQLHSMIQEVDNYIQQVNNIAGLVKSAKKVKTLANYTRDLNAIDTQWQYVSQSMQDYIAQYNELLTMAQQYQTVLEDTRQAIEQQKLAIAASADFKAAKKVIIGNQHNYAQWEAQVKQLTLTPKTAPLLERLKAQEAVKFQEVDAAYQKAQSSVEVNKTLTMDMESVKGVYIDLKIKSEAIQKAKYVPFIDRIKDYLMSFAGVAIIIMFMTVIASKIQALKAAREQAQKLKEMLEQNNQDIPTI